MSWYLRGLVQTEAEIKKEAAEYLHRAGQRKVDYGKRLEFKLLKQPDYAANLGYPTATAKGRSMIVSDRINVGGYTEMERLHKRVTKSLPVFPVEDPNELRR
ncbi:hypothetical protein FVE85_2923 [Porphyridium purpureum]|uniref:Uncharacterized protein n=1 Tax=Porphyridium purpureum TaxID=35688 RepID=A0A5J4YV14_PORPP|nr:hypothetical protein FVE85_2923 [Porphyridium purpureum]|eukprot:POR9302..scf227_4